MLVDASSIVRSQEEGDTSCFALHWTSSVGELFPTSMCYLGNRVELVLVHCDETHLLNRCGTQQWMKIFNDDEVDAIFLIIFGVDHFHPALTHCKVQYLQLFSYGFAFECLNGLFLCLALTLFTVSGRRALDWWAAFSDSLHVSEHTWSSRFLTFNSSDCVSRLRIPNTIWSCRTEFTQKWLSNDNPKPHWYEAPMVRNTIGPKHH